MVRTTRAATARYRRHGRDGRSGDAGARMIARHAARPRHRQHEHHDSACSGPARCSATRAGRHATRGDRRRARAAARRPARARRRRAWPTSTRSPLASVVPALTAASRRSPRGASGRCSSPAPAPCRSRSGSTGRTRSAPTGWSTPWPRSGCTGRRPSSSTSGPRRRSTASRADGAYVGGAIAPGPRARPRGARRADREAAADRAARRRTGRSGATPCRRDAVGHGLRLPGARGRAARAGPRRARRRERASRPADVRAILTGGLSAAPWARGLEGIDVDRPGPDPQGPRDPPRRGRAAASRSSWACRDRTPAAGAWPAG